MARKPAENGNALFRAKAIATAAARKSGVVHRVVPRPPPGPKITEVVDDNGNAHFRKQSAAVASKHHVVPRPPVMSKILVSKLLVDKPPVVAKAKVEGLWTEHFRPTTMRDVSGNATAKTALAAFVNARPAMCLLSGPVGVGKTSLAHAALRDSGRHVVDVRAKPDDFTALMDDLVNTPPRNPTGVVVDELENLLPAHRTFLLRLLKRPTQVHVILVCSDPTERALKPFAAAGPHFRMVTPRDDDVHAFVLRMCARTGITIDTHRANQVVQCARGDMRRVVATLGEMRTHQNGGSACLESSDVRFHTPFSAAKTVMHTRNIEQGVDAARTDRMLVRLMTVKQLPHVVDDLDDLAARMEKVSCADLLESHSSYTTLDAALWMHVAATSRTTPRPNTPRLQFPTAELGLFTKFTDNRDAVTSVLSTFRAIRHCGCVDACGCVGAGIHRTLDLAVCRNLSELSGRHFDKKDIKRVQNMKFNPLTLLTHTT